MPPATSELAWNAGYGRLPFNLFILAGLDPHADRWEKTTRVSSTEHEQRWNELVQEYLDLTLKERWSWYKQVRDVQSGVTGADTLPSPTKEQVVRMFNPHQTIQERNISTKFCCGWNIVWLRTWYSLVLSQKYLELEQAAGARVDGGCLESLDRILDDELLYAFVGTDQEVMDQLLLRVPGLTDAQGIQDDYGVGSLLLYGNCKEDTKVFKQNDANIESEVRTIALNVQNLLYVVDDEAVNKNVVKVWWFDEFGTILWDNIAEVPESKLDGILEAIMDGQGFADLVGEDSQSGDIFGA